MAVTKLTCPECGTVLRPGKPIPAGKKVKCPRCENIFAPDSDEDDPPKRKASADKGGRKPAKAAPKASEAPKKEEPEVYGYVKDPDEEDEDKKIKINYVPDISIKDPRGPAQSLLMGPSNKLALCGFIGFFAWLVLLILIMVPALFPLKEETTKPVLAIGPGLSEVKQLVLPGGMPPVPPTKPPEEEKPGFYEIGGIDLAILCDLAWYFFIIFMIPIVIFMVFCALVSYGALQLQNMESRGWGMASSIMVMVPFTIGGLQIVTGLLVQMLLGMIMDDVTFGGVVAIILVVVEWLLCVAVGVWGLMTVTNEDVIAGFEYEPE
jgi:hypothetical protein